MSPGVAGARLRELRLELGLSQAAFWEPLFVSQSYGSKIERGVEGQVPGLALHVLDCERCQRHFLGAGAPDDSDRNQGGSHGEV